MLHFVIGIILGAVGGVIAHHVGQDAIVTLLVGGGVTVLYWLAVAVCKGKLRVPEMDFDFGDWP